MENVKLEKQNILNYKLDQHHGYTRILVQLFGSAGHDKSSLINSFIYVLRDGSFKSIVLTQLDDGEETFGGLTTIRKSYHLTDSITVVDNRGFGKMDDYETGEIYAQLANILALDEIVEFEANTLEKTVHRVIDAEMNFTDLIVPVYVYRCEFARFVAGEYICETATKIRWQKFWPTFLEFFTVSQITPITSPNPKKVN
ncbi:hypothetical protein XELAEV_18045766mg [Xenopus laevis]|uniref:Uncharacterized protein n=1 Tax=Xenopus laevis TaxID=8355 RepID=A0A974H4K5_XENLA|nr:hypothetical protein XELAEV_18045766mg [Xenopus laevis]